MQEQRNRTARDSARAAAMRPGAPLAPREVSPPPAGLRLLGPTRAARRGASILAWTLPAAAIQAVCLLLPGRPKAVFARVYWAGVCRLLGLQVRVLGAPSAPSGRAVVFASNHSSWLDVPVLGGAVEACFVSKEEVGRWPVVSTVARLGRTVFVSRRAAGTGRERDAMRARLAAGDSLILFPEGTSSDGSRVLPFRSSFFSIVDSGGVDSGGVGRGERPPLIQPVSVVYDRVAWLPVGRAGRPVFAWYGDMDLGSHFWRVAQWRGLRVTVLLHAPVDPAAYASRKALAQAVWRTVADGAATLRQNRPAVPLAASALPA